MIPFILYVYAALLFIGGFIGFKAGSKVSLYMGVVSSFLILFGLFIVGNNAVFGYVFTGAVSGLLTGTFLIRLVKTKKFMPAGMLLIISAVACIISVLQVL